MQSTCTIQVTYKKTCFGGGGKSRIFVTNKFTEEAWSEDRELGRSGELAGTGANNYQYGKRGGAFFFPRPPRRTIKPDGGRAPWHLFMGAVPV